jgi:hypothetical protein
MPTPTTLPGSFTAGDVLTAANMNDLRGAFRILQVAQAAKTDTFSMSSATYADVTGLSVAITPYSNTSKFLLVAQVNVGVNGGTEGAQLRFTGGNSGNYVGDTAGSRTRVGTEATTANAQFMEVTNMFYLDSPATASAVTYKVQIRSFSANAIYVNRSAADTDNANHARAASSLIVLEVSA